MHSKIIMSLLVLSISRPLLAQASLCQTKTVVYFGNGIGSGIATAVNAGISLKSLKNGNYSGYLTTSSI